MYYPREALFADDILYNSTLIISSHINEDEDAIPYVSSGYLIKDNYLVTCYHTYEDICIKSKRRAIAFHCEDYVEKFDLEYVASDKHFDIAIFKISYKSDKIESYLNFYNGDINTQDRIYYSGYRNGYEFGDNLFITEDIINEIHIRSFVKNITYSGHIAPGMSGGPVTKLCVSTNKMQDKEYRVIGHTIRYTTTKRYEGEFELGVAHAYDIRDKIKTLLDL